jgi:hypothetical protein
VYNHHHTTKPTTRPAQVVAGAPGSRLVDLVVSPQVLVQQDNSKSALRLNATYYITKQVGHATYCITMCKQAQWQLTHVPHCSVL